MHYYRLVIKYNQLTVQANNYIDLWLHSHQQNKQTNKHINKKKYSQWWAVELDQFCWGARANLRSSRSGHQLMSPTTSFHIFNWSLYLQLQNAALNLSNFTVTLTFNREINYTCILWNKQIKPKK